MIFIRADANEKIGTGHVMRCLSIASAFAEKGEKVVFVTADHRGDKLIEQSGFDIVCLESDWTNIDKEIEALHRLISDMQPEMLIVDSYFVTEDYLRQLSSFVNTAYIDDLNQAVWDVDYLINYNIFAVEYDYSGYRQQNTCLLLGPQYAPLRKEFRNMPAHEIKDVVTNVFVSAGGSDPEKITERLMEQICPQMSDVNFHFVVGALNPRINEIKKLAGKNIILHINERNMSELMQTCDVGISASGSTLYEMCAVGIPTITYILADNQIFAAEQFEQKGIMLNAGDCRKDTRFTNRVTLYLNELCRDAGLRKSLSLKMQKLVDGNGVERIANRLN